MFEAKISVNITSLRPKNTLVTDQILDATLSNTLIVLVEYTRFCQNLPFAIRNYLILCSFEHPLGSFGFPLGSFGFPLGSFGFLG